jgi:N-methylhydantoinase B
MLERTYPLRFGALRLLTDSGGAGRRRGGPASELIYGPRATPMRVFYLADFARNPALGVAGGQAGVAASVSVIDGDGHERSVEPVGDSRLRPGEAIRGVEAGGGGYGDPLERDPAAVLEDVLERWVSREAASDVYGVVFLEDEACCQLSVDSEGTHARREALPARGTSPSGCDQRKEHGSLL